MDQERQPSLKKERPRYFNQNSQPKFQTIPEMNGKKNSRSKSIDFEINSVEIND